jgi:hypothetical protein
MGPGMPVIAAEVPFLSGKGSKVVPRALFVLKDEKSFFDFGSMLCIETGGF